MSSSREDIVALPGQAGPERKKTQMFGPFIVAASEPAIAHGMRALQLTGSPLHALLALVGHALSNPQARHEGENDDA